MVYILSLTGKPLMPTKRHGKVRRLLRDGLAKVVKRCPFTIQLLFETGEEVQPVVLGVDAGSRHIGISATTEGKVLYEADVELRNDIVELLSTRREARRARRNRKTRYRKPRFLNRVHSKNKVKLSEDIKRGNRYNDAAFMGIMRWTVYNRLKEIYPAVRMTYGFITKNIRIQNELPKEHYIDARCISGHPKAESDGIYYYQKKVRCHNRQIHKFNIPKGGKRKLNQAPYLVKGYRLFDKVCYQGQEGFIFGRRSSGYFDLRTLSQDAEKKVISRSASAKKLHLLEKAKPYLIERRKAASSPSESEDSGGVSAAL